MGNCLQQGTGHIDSDTNDDKHHVDMDGKSECPTIQGNAYTSSNNSVITMPQKGSNTITAMPNDNSNIDGSAGTSTTGCGQQQNRKHSFDSETKQILNDESLFSREAVRISHQFWNDNVLILSNDRRQEIGVTLYAQMFRKMPECRKIFLRGDIEKTSEKFLGMMGWLIMELNASNAEVWTDVKKLGKLHRNIGITYEHYLPMLQAFHITFQEQFPKVYSLRIKFCIENLFMNAAKLMTEKDFITLFAERVQDLETLEFLDSLDACLAHQTGREYLERYLEQTFCAEYVLFLRAFDEYKQLGNIQQRYEKAKEIYNNHFLITSEALIELNTDKQKQNIINLESELSKYAESNESNNINENLLDSIYSDVKQIIEEQSWDKFHDGIYSIKQATRSNATFNL